MSDDIHSLAGLYALDALDDLERRRFESHLETCGECLEEVDGFEQVAAALTDREVMPSGGLRDSTLGLIARTPQIDPQGSVPQGSVPDGSASDGSASDGSASDGSTSSRLVPDPGHPAPAPDGSIAHQELSGRGDTRNARKWVLSAAAVLLVVAALAAIGVIATRNSGDGGNDEIAIVLDAPDAIHIPMHSDDPARASTDLEVVHSADHNATVVVGDHVHGTDPGKTYQMWGITADGPVPAGVFEPSEDGTVEAPVGTPKGVEEWVVTVEPAGGLPEPSGEAVFTSQA